MQICINGKFVEKQKALIPVFDHGLLYGDGVFETLAVVDGMLIDAEAHLERMFSGCKRLHIKPRWSKTVLHRFLKDTVRKNTIHNGRVRMMITRGVGDPMIAGSPRCKPTLIIYGMPVSPLQKVQEKGMHLRSTAYYRFLPEIKSLNYLPSVLGYLDAKAQGYDDAIFVDEKGLVTEGTTFNIFLVKDHKIRTPSSDMLGGVTRKRILEIARHLKFDVQERPIRVQELYDAIEVFITGSVRRIVPVVQIDRRKIGNGKRGRVTQQLQEEYHRRFEQTRSEAL